MLPNKVDNIDIRFKRENYINYLEDQCRGHRYIIHIGSALHAMILLYVYYSSPVQMWSKYNKLLLPLNSSLTVQSRKVKRTN